MQHMTSRQRMLTAMRKGTPDRVPVAPDISNMIPCRLTGKPFWDIYFDNDPPLWEAYLDALRHFDFDGWFVYGELAHRYAHEVRRERVLLSRTDDALTARDTFHTPEGSLSEVIVYPRGNPPTRVEKLIKDFERDFAAYKYLIQPPIGFDDALFRRQKAALGELGVMCVDATEPGLHALVDHFDDGLEGVTYAMYDHPALFEELIERLSERAVARCECAIRAYADSVLTGGSGSITLASPELWRRYSLPTIQRITRLCKQAGVISGIHSCGFEMDMVKACAAETDLDYINPLEIPPMGDCTLKTAREQVGNRLCLMGNLHTTELMLHGSADDVRRACLRALLDAAADGAFVLSTGDQCGRDTPDENIFAMVETVQEFGTYPLDTNRIQEALNHLGDK